MSRPLPEVGARVKVTSNVGTVRFVGETGFLEGTWIGVEFDDEVGKCDGTGRDGVKYFECTQPGKRGRFLKPAQVRLLKKKKTREAAAAAAAATSVGGAAAPKPEKKAASKIKASKIKAKRAAAVSAKAATAAAAAEGRDA